MKNFIAVFSFLFLLAACEQHKKETSSLPKGYDISMIDSSIQPCDNFYLFAVGGWLKNNPVPPTEARWGSFNLLKEENLQKIKTILQEASSHQYPPKSPEQIVGDFYLSALDSAKIEQLGLTPLIPILQKIENIQSMEELFKMVAWMNTYSGNVLAGIRVESDAKNSTKSIVYIGQGTLGLPDKSYYFPTNEKEKNLLFAYQQYIQQILTLWKKNERVAEGMATTILKIETSLASISYDMIRLRNFTKNYHKYDYPSFKKHFKGIPWDIYFSAFNFPVKIDSLVSTTDDYLEKLPSVLKQYSLEQWKIFMQYHLLLYFSPYLPYSFQETHFNFFSKTLSGINSMKPRWKLAIEWTNAFLGEPVGRLFVKKYFPESSKKYISDMVELMREVYKERIQQLDWMSDSTKQKALEKLALFNKKIGYPDRWKDISQLDIHKDSLIHNILSCSLWLFQDNINKLGKPIDKSEWDTYPQIVNAYYHPLFNDITFPAGILQPPFYDSQADDAINFGGIGTVIGHEFTHGFDDMGSQYDGYGNIHNWWTEEDYKKFEEKGNALVEQFNAYEVADSNFVNGRLTLGENIADLGGIILAYYALKKKIEKDGKEPPVIDGFTWQQRFFLSWANVWKLNITKEEDIRLSKIDPHAPSRYRVIGPLSNLKEFSDAFGCKTGKMIKPENERIKIW